MLHILIQVLVTAIAVLIAARIVPGIRVRSFGSAVVFAFVLGVLGALLKTVLVIVSLPFIVVTFGLFLIVINGFLFWLADKIVKGVECDGFGAAMLGSLVTSGATWLIFYALHHL